MAKKFINMKKINTLMLSALLMSQQSIIPAALAASDITGVIPNGNTYNIDPTKVNGDVGFRHYTNFELDKGDIANLIFKSGATDIEHFVNLVDNQILINGFLNTVRNGNFYNGHAVFVSPNGMVIGASGVLNVGSLTAIAPNPNDYIKYTGLNMDQATADKAAAALGKDNISISGLSNMTLADLAKGDMAGDITVNGRIFARKDVNLYAQNVVVQGDKAEQNENKEAAIIAGIQTTKEAVITTDEQAANIFNALVGTDTQNGTGFTRDASGNVVIQAQSIKDNGDANASVKIADARIESGNINVNAMSKSSYSTDEDTPSGTSLKTDDSEAENKLNNVQNEEGNADYEGAVANSSVIIDNGASLKADADISIRSLAQAETSVKSEEVLSIYAFGSDTSSDVIVKNGSELNAGTDIDLISASRNSLDVAIKGTSSGFAEDASDFASLNLPNYQVEILSTMVSANTNAKVEQGAQLTAGNDVNVEALNMSDASVNLDAEAEVERPENGQAQSGAAFTLNFTKTDINTTAEVGGVVNSENLLVSSQNYHLAGHSSSSSVHGEDVNEITGPKDAITDRFKGKVSNLIFDNVSGLSEALDSYTSGLSEINANLPSASLALVVNDQTINTTAKISNTADITVNNNVDVIANAIDKTINDVYSGCKIPQAAKPSTGTGTGGGATTPGTPATTAATGTGGAESFKIAPGLAVLVNNQTNNTTAIIEDGSSNAAHATVKAGGTVNVNATTELPMNDSTFQFALNVKDGAEDTAKIFDFSGDDWNLKDWFAGAKDTLDVDIQDIKTSFSDSAILNTLGVKGVFNNWAVSSSSSEKGLGIAASVVVSDINNNTVARIGDYTTINSVAGGGTKPSIKVNAANSVTQFNAAGDIEKFWKPTAGNDAKFGVGGAVIVEEALNNAKAEIGNFANIEANKIDLTSASLQNYLTVGIIGGQSGSDGGATINGSVLVQTIEGETLANIGSSTINANSLTMKAGEANIKLAPSALDELTGTANSDITASINPDENTGILKGDAVIELLDSSKIEDKISNLVITGALSKQKDSAPSSGQTSSSGVAVGASVNVGIIDRSVKSIIADNADITLADSLIVDANTSSQALDVALAGAFAGGVKTESWLGQKTEAVKNKVNGVKSRVQGMIDDFAGAIVQDGEQTKLGKLDENGNPMIAVNGTTYKTDANGNYVDSSNKPLLDASGNQVKAQSLNNAPNPTQSTDGTRPQLNNQQAATQNMSIAAAGAINVQVNDSTVEASVGNANIKVGNNVEVKAEQSTKALNVGGGAASAKTAGAGAAVNVIKNSNTTSAKVDGATITYTGSGANKLDVKAVENNDNIQVAIGVGVAKSAEAGGGAGAGTPATPGTPVTTTATGTTGGGISAGSGATQGGDTAVALGGSFNTDYLVNTVTAEIKNATIKNANSNNNIDITVAADNYSTSYKGAGALSYTKTSGAGVGAGMSGNLNVIKKTTTARIDNSAISNASNIEVVANKDAGLNNKKTEDLISVGLSASIISSGESGSGYTFDGTMGTDSIDNNITAEIVGKDNKNISAGGDINVKAHNNVSNWNAAGGLGFSGASKGAGVGVGAIVNVFDNDVNARIDNVNIINANDVNVDATNEELLKFVAVNFGMQTSGGHAIGVNGIVNVIQNTINAEVVNSSITNNGAMSVLTDYNTNIKGGTLVAQVSGSGVAFGANIVVNTLTNDNIAKIEDSNITSDGALSVSAQSAEEINLLPVSVSAAINGKFAAAANIAVNNVFNTTKAYIDKSVNNTSSNISASGISITAVDNTHTVNRGGVLAASGAGSAIGGSIISDVFLKDVDAYIDNVTVANGGNINVSASAENIFGAKNPDSVTASGLYKQWTNSNENGSTATDVSEESSLLDWDMTYDVSGSMSVSVAGSLISKVVVNDINSYIGSNVTVQNAGNISVSAENETSAAAIIGNIAGSSGSAGIGASIFSNVNASTVNAGIKNGANIGTNGHTIGNVTVSALSDQKYHAVNFAVAGASNAAVNGSVISNVVVNETNAYIDKNVNIASNGGLTMTAKDSMEVEELQLAVGASGSAAVGVIADVNVLNNKVNSIIGRNNDNVSEKSGSLTFAGAVKSEAVSAEDVLANVFMINGSGAAAVGGVVISNTLASDVNSGIEEVTLTSGGNIDVIAKNSFNEKNKDKTNVVTGLLSKASIDSGALIPIVGVLNISGSGTASVGASVVNSNVITEVNAYVRNAQVTNSGLLHVDADSIMTTYDAVMGVAASGSVAAAASGVVNTYSGVTNAEIYNSTINGNTSLTANDFLNLNTIIFNAAGSGQGAAISGVVNVNTINNEVLAKITGASKVNGGTVSVVATNEVNAADILAAGSGTGVGVAANIVPITNVFGGTTSAYISSQSVIDGANLTVKAVDNIDVKNGVVGIAGAGVGANVSGYAITNVFNNNLNAYISDTTIKNTASTLIQAQSDLDMTNLIVSGGVTGVGASVILNGLTNVINNTVNSYVSNSSITGGSVSVTASQNSNILNNTDAVSVSGAGASASVNALTNVFTNTLNSYILNTSTDNTSAITVTTESIEDIQNLNMGFSFSSANTLSAATIVNVLENTSHAYIDAKEETMNSSGKITVKSEDTLKLRNTMGLLGSAAGATEAGNVTVNIINNAVKAEILSQGEGSINAKGVDVLANSTFALNQTAATGAIGLGAGIAGTVVVTSIGDRYTNSSSDLQNAGIDEALQSAKDNYDRTGGQSGEVPELELGVSSKHEGTVANVSAKVASSAEINVKANNVVKGYDTDTLNITNAVASAGVVGAGVGVLVTDMDYNTHAEISGGNVSTSSGNINVMASNTVKANTDAIQATAGAVAIGGNVAYFNNSANTIAQIDSATVRANNNLSIVASSVDNIVSNAISGSIGGKTANVVVAVAETGNDTKALILGNVDVDAANINIKAQNTSSLSSQMASGALGQITLSAVVNRTQSKSITQALISSTAGSVEALNALNITSETGGINVTNNVVLGSVGLAALNVNTQFANAASTFESGVANGAVVNANSIKIKSGTKNDTDDAGLVSATVNSAGVMVGGVTGSVTYLDARAKGVSTAYGQGKITSKLGDINILSKLNRTAQTTSNNLNVSGVNIGGLGIVTNAGGSTNINTEGGTLDSSGNINLTTNSVNNSYANSASKGANLVKASVYSLDALVESGSDITLGDMSASGNITASVNNDQTANLGRTSYSFNIAGVDGLIMNATASGTSSIKGNGTATANNVSYTVTSNTKADAKMNSGEVSLADGGGTNVYIVASSDAIINSGNINANNVNLKTNVTRNATITDKNKSLSLVGVGVTNLNTKVAGKSKITTDGTIQNKSADGKAQKVEITSNDTSLAKNDSATSSLSFVKGGSLRITSLAESQIINTIGGTIKANTLNINSNLNRTTVANATTSSAGLVNIGVMNLLSKIDKSAKTTFNGTIEAGNLKVDSNMTNHVDSYVKDFSAGLVALAHGETKNEITDKVKNIVDYRGTINANTITSTVDTISKAELYKESGQYGLFVIKGGKLTNILKAGSETNFNDSSITTTGDATFKVKNTIETPSVMQVTDDAGGFVVSSGAELSNTIGIGSSMNFNADSQKTLIQTGGALDIDISSGTKGFGQIVKSSGSGFTASNNAKSVVNATINNFMNLNSGKVIAKHLDVNMNSSNELSSEAYAEAHHFAGSPSVESRVNLTVNNTVNVGGELFAQSNDGNTDDTAVNINFMHGSVQNIRQYSDLYVEAAVATGSASGSINFATNNNINVKSGGKISSQKDINVVFDRGRENLSSKVVWDKVSRLLFGIPIHDSGSKSSVSSTSRNNVRIDGKLVSGKATSMKLVINKDGSAENSTLLEGTHYTKVDTTSSGSDQVAIVAEIEKLQNEIKNLTKEKEQLQTVKEVSEAEYDVLQKQIDSLKLELAVLKATQEIADNEKISQSEFSGVILEILQDYDIADPEKHVAPLLDLLTINFDQLYATDKDGSQIISYVKDAATGGYATDEHGNYLLKGYTYQYADGKLLSDADGNILVKDANDKQVTLYTLTMNNYTSSLITTQETREEFIGVLSTLRDDKIGSKDITVSLDNGSTQTVKMATYDGKVIYYPSEDIITSLTDMVESSEAQLELVNENLTKLANNIVTIENTIEANTKLVEYINENGLTVKAENGTYYFNPINASSGSINIKANKGSSNVFGTGAFEMSLADILINNYSNYNLHFSDLTVGGDAGSISIDGRAINGSSYRGVALTTTGSPDNLGGITINNWYDHNDPANNTAVGVLPSNITFIGEIIAKNGNVNIYNGSGDVTINNLIDARKVAVTVPQGSFTQDTYGRTYYLAAADTLFAGKDINITASNFDIAGTMQAGVANRNITITEDMITNAIDETVLVASETMDEDGNIVYEKVKTGRKLLNLSYGRDTSEGTKPSDYMYDKNNIKAVLHPDGTIELFGVEVTDRAGIYLTSTGSSVSNSAVDPADAPALAINVADSATMKYANGYGTINIDNQTNHKLMVNGVQNNKITGDITYTYKDNAPLKVSEGSLPASDSFKHVVGSGRFKVIKSTLSGVSQTASLVNTANQALTDGKITIDTTASTGDLNVRGLISSGNLTAEESGLELKAKGNINIMNRVLAEGSTSQVPTIQTLGDILISNVEGAPSSIYIDGEIDNTGNITITNNATGALSIGEKGYINNKNGVIRLTNENGDAIRINGKVKNNAETTYIGDSDIIITNNSGLIASSADSLIQNNSKITITNSGSNGVQLGGTIKTVNADIDITNNKGNFELLSTSNINLNEVYTNYLNSINITNNQNSGAMTIAGAINNYGKRDINITNLGSGKLTSTANIMATDGDIDITNSGVDGALLSGTITDKKGNINIINEKGKLTTARENVIKNNQGTTKITSKGTEGAELNGQIVNIGKVEVMNDTTSGAMKIAGLIRNTGNTDITNNGAGAVTISGIVNNSNGLVKVANNSEAGTTVSGTISNKNGNIDIASTKGEFKLTDIGAIENNKDNKTQVIDQDITISNSGNSVLSLLGTIFNNKGNVEITNNTTSNNSVIGGTITNQDGNTIITNTKGDLLANGTITNSGNVSVENADDMTISGTVSNKDGEVLVQNTTGKFEVTTAGKIQNNLDNANADAQDITIENTGSGILSLLGTMFNKKGNVEITNNTTSNDSVIGGTITNQDGDTIITNTKGDLLANGIINNSGNVSVENSDDITLDGTINNTGDTTVTNTESAGKLLISGTVNNTGDTRVTNNGETALISGTINNDGNTTVTNNGTAATVSGTISNKNGNISVASTNGGFNVTDTGVIENNKDNESQTDAQDITITNSGNSVLSLLGTMFNKKGNVEITNNTTSNDSVIGGTITNQDGNTTITNTKGDLLVNGTITNKGNVSVENSDDITLDGTINNTGNTTVTSTESAGKLLISGTVNNTGNTTVTNDGNSAEISGTINNTGDTRVTNNGETALISGTINNDGNTTVTNNGTAATVSGTISNKNGNISVASTNGQFKLTDTGVIENNRSNNDQKSDEDITITNSGNGLLSLFGEIFNKKGSTKISNTNENSGIELGVTVAEDKVTHRGSITNESGSLAISNDGNKGINILGDIISNGKTTIENTATGIYIATIVTNKKVNKGTITTTGDLVITNSGSDGINVFGDVVNSNGNLTVDNKNGGIVVDRTYTSDDSFINGKIENNSDETSKLLVKNSGDKGITVKGDIINSQSGDLTIENNNSAIITTLDSVISQNNGTLNVLNNGFGGIELSGAMENKKGITNITNNNENAGILITTTGTVTNNDGNVNISNKGSKGIDVEGLVDVKNQNIVISNKNSNLEIGEYDSDNDFYLNTANGNIIVNQINGNVINGITDVNSASNQNQDLANPDKSYKTLMKTSNDLIVNVEGGNFGSDTNALKGKDSGFGVNASTRDYTESINVNVGNRITANASNNGKALINVRAKESDLKVNKITSDGGVMVTAVDWKQADTTSPSGDVYYVGYSVVNAADNYTSPNVTAKNISVISSNNIGSNGKRLTYNQLPAGSVSMMAENNIYAEGFADNDNVWQLVAKQGDTDVIFNGNASVREVTSGSKVSLISKGSDLTIYDMGKTPNLQNSDDILFHHDRLSLSTDVIPENISLAVINTNENTKQSEGGTLSIYNALVRGTNGTEADVVLIGDNIIANAYDAPSSPVSTPLNPNGFNAASGRTYSNDYTDANSAKNLKATGFTTSGNGSSLVFDIQGVSPELVKEVGGNVSDRAYNSQNSIVPVALFQNPNAFSGTVYKANNVTLSLNSYNNAPSDNRGLLINTLYTDNAYVDTRDLTLDVKDGFITDYAEFRNGNREGSSGGPKINEDYRYSAIIDNVGTRDIWAKYHIPVSAQFYTAKTGSFNLSLGDTLAIQTSAPAVLYDKDAVVNTQSTENSFYKLTYKNDKLQNATTLQSFRDDDRDTYKPTKREFIRFNLDENVEEYVRASEHNKSDKNSRIVSVVDISRGGVLVTHDGSLKEHEKFIIDLTCQDITATPEVEVVYISEDKAGLNFINLDEATANKILYINLTLSNIKTDSQMSKL